MFIPLLLSIFLLSLNSLQCNGQEQAQNEDDCVCVPYYQCEEGKVITTGEGLLDFRLKTCTGIEVCCQLPDDTTGGDSTDRGPLDGGARTETPVTDSTPTREPPTPDTGNVQGPSVPAISGGEGCGRRRFAGEGNNIDNSLRITGPAGYPEETFYGEVPWMVRLLFMDNGQINDTFLMCGGALITPSVVLTAAHCVNNINNNQMVVRAGDWNIQQNFEPIAPQDRNVIRTILHPEFNSRNLANDIALIGLESPMRLTQTVDIVCTPDAQRVVNGSACLASGWGKNELSRYGTYQDTLRKVSLPLIDKAECQTKLRKTKLGKYFTLLPGFLCAGGSQNSDTCEGDGGGPLYCPIQSEPDRFAVVGVISWGIDCGKGNPAVFADVNHYMPWIKQQIS
uniref:Phenoloxidase-activating factor 2 n=1 Tax=Panstrongylus lignarius TaxID=156445 RepID=A0A224XDU5_9HEMI